MKKVRVFLIDSIVSLLISAPFVFLCDWMGRKELVDWLDIQLALSGFAVIMLIANILLARREKTARITAIVNSVAIVALASTIIYGVFMILEWLFPGDTAGSFTGNWVQWFPVSISLAIFLHLQERHRMQNYKSENDLVVAAECHDIAEAEKLSAMLEEKGIKAMTVEKANPMYIDSCSDAPLQVQVMGKDLHSVKKVLKLEAV